MKALKIALLFAISIFLMTSCSESNEELLQGTWREVNTGESLLNYYEDGTYKFEYDNNNFESGKWHIEGKTLYTTVDETEEELNEEITLLNETTLVVTIGGTFQTTYERYKK